MKKKLLIYAHYYAPDVASTGQILQDLAEGLLDSFDVSVICTVPSYTGTVDANYKTKRYYIENINGVKVYRVAVPEFNKSSKLSRIRNIFAYIYNAIRVTKVVGYHDYILSVSQPPFFGGLIGVYSKIVLGNKTFKPKLIYQIQDFNPEQIETVGYFKNKILIWVLKQIDKFSCKKSDLVITVGRDLVETLKQRFNYVNVPNCLMINNWIDDVKIHPVDMMNSEIQEFKLKYDLNDKYIIMYSGNIGLYYDLEGLFRVIEKFKLTKTPNMKEVVFAFVGTGSLLDKLKKYKNEHDMSNVVFLPYQDKEKLVYSLNAADVHFCVNAKGIKGVSCPSKFYGIIAVAKPVIGVLEEGSEIQMLIKEIGCGLHSEPGDYNAIYEIIDWFIKNAGSDKTYNMGIRGFEYLKKHLTKELAISKYKEAILTL